MYRMIAVLAFALTMAGCAGDAAPTRAEFVPMAASSNNFEIRSSRLALSRAQSPEVRQFASKMIEDHLATAERMRTAVGDAREIPVLLAGHHQAMLEALADTSVQDFDAAYANAQATAHEEAVALFAAYADAGDDPTLAAFAREALPALRMHGEMARGLPGGG